jgi:hypothetical protein
LVERRELRSKELIAMMTSFGDLCQATKLGVVNAIVYTQPGLPSQRELFSLIIPFFSTYSEDSVKAAFCLDRIF